MIVKSNYKTTIAVSQSASTDELDEAIKILEEETTRRIEDIQQQVEFMCESIRAQGNTYLNTIIKPVRELTVSEFCETFGADIQTFLDKKKDPTSNQFKTDVPHIDEGEKAALAKDTIKPFELHINKDHTSELSLRLDPNWSSVVNPEDYTLTIPSDIQQQLNQAQKERIVQQIQAFKDQLDLLQKNFLCSNQI
ncbi:hypothetical protein EDC96DRAFT_493748 [Choanephora cucurbitarum]|nr:hypothetical protein EDC96DRAFT_493748 [Choanephora cucurbitarum]